jgi:2-aminoethylphosphonate-pyruvate transaminase
MLQHVKSITTPRPILLCPGPVMLSKAVRDAVANTCIGHREPEFSQIMAESCAMIKPIVGIEPDDPSYQVALITGSGTAGNETVLSALVQLGRMLVITNGEFGERLLEVSRLHSDAVDHLHFDWQQAYDLEQIEHALRTYSYKSVVMVHHDTSTGILNPVEKVCLPPTSAATISISKSTIFTCKTCCKRPIRQLYTCS